MANRLADERSPYLLQHANNPVDWYPWGEPAFERARRENKPIFLSIGYSTCHWCHVMEHESFEDAAVAGVLNRSFVSIKVDREERPDVDRVYMTFVQATTGAGGWPMSVWLTPERQPFFGGTYFPPTSRWGRPGFVDVLDQIAQSWQSERDRITQSAAAIVERLREATGAGASATDRAPVADREAIDAGIASFAQAFDARHGGFGGAPKFPRPAELLFLLHAYAFTGNDRARHMALTTLDEMAKGGMRDQLGGGFHRYSVDAEWRVPHFEKMLYDQAQLVLAYLEAAQVSGDARYAAVAEDTLAYVRRDLTAPEDGSFYSAEDADSISPQSSGPQSAVPGSQPLRTADHGPRTESREGAFYVWTGDEIDRLLGDDAAIVRRRFGVEDGGNAPADPQGEFHGQNILYAAQTVDEIAVRTGRSTAEVEAALARARDRLVEARQARPRPHLDDKIITAWNGLMIAAFARAARVLVDSPRRDEWRAAAVAAAEAARRRLWRTDERRLFRRYRDGEAAVDAFCEDYACLAWGLLELFQATGDVDWLDWAVELTAIETTLFHDERDGGWFSTTGDDPSVLLRLKEDYDGAEPSAASVTVRNLIVLGHLVDDPTLVERAQGTLERYGAGLGRVARVMPLMLANVVLWRAAMAQVVLVGPRPKAEGPSETREGPRPKALGPRESNVSTIETAVARTYLPWAIVIPIPDAEAAARLATPLPWLATMQARDGQPTAYVCHNFTCREPVTDPSALGDQLRDVASPRRLV